MPDILDNLRPDSTLGGQLKLLFDHDYEHIDVATGYLDLRGWNVLGDVIDAKEKPADRPTARVLVGMVAPADGAALLAQLQSEIAPEDPGAGIPDPKKARDHRDRLVAHLRTQLMRGLPSNSTKDTLKQMKTQLGDGRVQVRVYTRQPLHGKLYLLGRDHHLAPRFGFLGSSNFTGAGLLRNLELNTTVEDKSNNVQLADWFEELWADKYTLEVTNEIVDLIEESWAGDEQPTPYEVYLKICHALSQDAREGMGYVLPQSMQQLLLDYQSVAVKTLARRIVARGGTMLGDVVGLGKTLTAIATALMLQAAEDYSTLVLCPKNLQKMWEEHVEEYGLQGARVVPYSMAHKVLPELKLFKLVICDESHNLRNDRTRAHEAISEYVRRNSAKVLLLTATPYNLAFADVASQLSLYIEPDDDLGIAPTEALKRNPSLADRVDHKTTTLDAFRLSEEPEDWRRLMGDHLVRRTRSFIRRSATKTLITRPDGSTFTTEVLRFADGREFTFPTRVPRPLTHAFGPDDPAALMEDDFTLDVISALTLARYRLADYEDSRAPKTEEDKKHLDDIRSGRGNVSGFVRTGLYKRLSSSGHALILSLQRQRARNELYLYAIAEGRPLPLGTFTDQQLGQGPSTEISDIADVEAEASPDGVDTPIGGSAASRYATLANKAPAGTKWINSTVFRATLRTDLTRDNEAITGLLSRFGTWDSTRDSKINALIDDLRGQHAGHKVLIFTEYRDTALYIAGALTQAGIPRVGLATGESEDPGSLARRFSPRSNTMPGQDPAATVDPDDELDVLVATDVLSEGQNLQDCHIIVNYDLPWAIIRLIQRAGRVDRIGQASVKVYIYLVSHEKIEHQIKLRQRIRQRLSNAANAFGSDEQFFGTADEVKILDDLYNGRMPDLDADASDEAEADAVSEAWLVWSNALTDYPAIAKHALSLPELVHTTRDPYASEATTGVACYVSTEAGVDAFGWYDDRTGATTLLTPMEALRRFRAEPTTPTVNTRADHFDRERDLVHGPLSVESSTAGNLKGIRAWAWKRLAGTIWASSAEDALNALHARPLTTFASHQLSQARRNRYPDDDLAGLLRRLHDEERLVIPAATSDDLRIVCSLGVTHR